MTIVYRRFGGSTHVRCDTFAQLQEAALIPETQYVATSAPVASFLCDPAFLRALDADDNGRVRVDELQSAVAWLAARLKDFSGTDATKDALTLTHLKDDQGTLKAAAAAVLEASATGADKNAVTLAQVRAADAPLRARGENGDGIVAPAHIPDDVRALGTSIMGLFAETKNRADVAGLAPSTLTAFKDARTALLAHLDKREAVFVWGDDSLARAQRITAVADKLDEHFLLCRLVASQPDARERFRLAADKIESLVGDKQKMVEALASLPICPPDPQGVIAFSTLHRGPSFEALTAFAADVVKAVTGSAEQLTESAWTKMRTEANAILAWQKTVDDGPLKSLAGDVAALKGMDDALAALAAAQEKDLARKDALQAIADLEKVILLQRYLLPFANSFLAMPDVYTDRRALYERGWAVIAGRRYELSVLVPDVGAHKAATATGTTCVIYANVEDKAGGTFDLALPKTRGWSTELQVGKRGIFYDLSSKEYDLTVTHIVRHPVSVIEAALSPFSRIGEFINKKLEGMNAGVGAAIEKKTTALNVKIDDASKTASSSIVPIADKKIEPTKAAAADAPPAPPAPPAPAAAPGSMSNALAMGGLAVAAVGSSVAFVANQLKALTLTDLVSIILIAFLVIAVPSGFVGWLKLRKRNIAELLEGAGWALNDRLRLTPQLTARITQTPSRVKGSSIELMTSPPAPGEPDESHTGLKVLAVIAVVLVVLWQVRHPLLKAGCHTGKVPEVVCAVADIQPAPHESAPSTAR